ncbi:MAG: PEP-CTERM sorting domain-containing protein [Verrucomicrobiales bacterium]
MKTPILAALAFSSASFSAHATIIMLENGDFESTTQNAFANGFDDNGGYDTPGWQDFSPPLNDAGVEGAGAWWGTFSGYSAFLAQGDGTYLLTNHVIAADDIYDVSLMAKSWDNASGLTLTLFAGSDPNLNTIGTFNSSVDGTWTEYSDNIAATAGVVGQNLGILVLNPDGGFLNFDNVAITVVPEPSSVVILGCALLTGFLRRRR